MTLTTSNVITLITSNVITLITSTNAALSGALTSDNFTHLGQLTEGNQQLGNSALFSRGFLIITPGITIRDRLRVLLPSDSVCVISCHKTCCRRFPR
jgi:hypothetical protein